jgi:hypothetical protein
MSCTHYLHTFVLYCYMCVYVNIFILYEIKIQLRKSLYCFCFNEKPVTFPVTSPTLHILIFVGIRARVRIHETLSCDKIDEGSHVT